MSRSIVPDPEITWGCAQSYMTQGLKVMLLAEDSTGRKVPPRNCDACNFRVGAPYHPKETCACILCHGFHRATSDEAVFERMLAALPLGSLAVRTGRASGVLVIDAEADGEPSGLEVIDQWESYVGGWSLPPTLTARSVSGGVHLWYRLKPRYEHTGMDVIKSGRVLPGVDVKAESGYVGVPCGANGREWMTLGPCADAPVELLEWLTASRRMSWHGDGLVHTGVGGHAPGYDYETFKRDGCPDGHRDAFFNDLLFRLRKKGYARSQIETVARVEWQRCAQPPDARYEMPWSDVVYKMARIWNEVQPDVGVSDALQRWASAAATRNNDERDDGVQRVGRVAIQRRGRGVR